MERPTIDWISVKDAMPDSGKKVLATYKNSLGNDRIIVGNFVERFTEETGVDDDWFEYSEETDEYYLPAGWYEQQDNWDEYGSIFVNEGEITHWSPLPKLPE